MTTDDAGSAPEADADPTRFSPRATEPAPAETTPPRARRRQRRRATRAGWRRWRRSRPFWGGLLLVLSGLELLALPLTGVLIHGAIKLVIYIGIGGVFGVLIGILLIAAGIVLWVNPTHRVFYGIAGIVLGIVSFPASNLGGFVLGMLLAIIGGALAFAWVPAEPESADAAPAGRAADDAPEGRADDDAPEGRADDDEQPSAGRDLISGARAENPRTRTGNSGTRAEWEGTATIAEEAVTAADGVGPRVGDAAGHRTLAVAAMPALLVAGLLGTGGAAKAASTQPDGNCILGVICLPSASPTPTPTPTASASTPSPTPTASSSPGPASPSPTPPAGGSGTGTPTATPSTSASASPSPSGTSTSAARSATAKGKKADPKDAAAPSGVTASAAASVLTAGSVTLDGFQYQGNVSVPVSGGGSEEMMEFTASSADLSGDVTVSVTQGGLTTDTSSPTLGFSDGMTLYATKLCGNLLGVLPVCFTPSTVSAVLLSIANVVTAAAPITMTDVTTDQPLTTAGTLQTGSLTIGF